MGLLNLYVAFNFSENTWVNFKLFGISAMMFLFIVGQMLLLGKYVIEEEKSE
jgi:intracellular septation protein